MVFGVISSGRPPGLAGAERMLGLFINTLPLRVSVARGAGIAAWLRGLQAEQAAILEVEHSALRQVQAWSDVPRGTPLFESLVDFVSYPPETALAAGDAPLDARDLRVNERPSYPLALIASPGRELSLRLLFDPQRLDGAAAVYNLSRAQRLVAGYIVDGHALPDIAEAMGITVSTVRTHLERIFVKTGVRNQTALVRVLLSVGAPF